MIVYDYLMNYPSFFFSNDPPKVPKMTAKVQNFAQKMSILRVKGGSKIYKISSLDNDSDVGSKLNLVVNHALNTVYWDSNFLSSDICDWPAALYKLCPSD